MRGTPCQSDGPRCEPRKNELSGEHALHLPLQRCCVDSPDFFCDLALHARPVSGAWLRTPALSITKGRSLALSGPLGCFHTTSNFKNKDKLPERARKVHFIPVTRRYLLWG